MQQQELIFLISQPRAGSTILQRLLQSHPEIHSTPEPWIMLHPLYGLMKQGFEAEYNAAWANTAVRDFYQALPDGEESYFKGLRHMYGYLYEQALEGSGKRYFLDKTPRYYHIIPELVRTFPEAKFIILFRNPVAVLASILSTWIKRDYFKLKNFKYDLLHAPQLLIQATELLKSKSLTVVFYENLLTNPESELKKICNQLAIEFNAEMLTCKSIERMGFGYKDQSSKFLNNGLMSTNLDKWMMKFDDPQCWHIGNDYLELLGQQTIDAMGYSYAKFKDYFESKRPTRMELWPTFPLEWLLMNSVEKRASKNNYFFAQAIYRISSLSESHKFDFYRQRSLIT